MNMINRASLFAVSGSVLSLVLSTDVSSASYMRSSHYYHPGVMCKYYGPQGGDAYLDPSGLSAVGIKNTSASNKNVVCPIVKPNSRYHDGVQEAYDTDFARLISTTSAMSCSFYRRNAGSFGSVPTDTVTNLGDGYWLYEVGTNSYLSTYNSAVSWYCALPAGQSIMHYWHDEGPR